MIVRIGKVPAATTAVSNGTISTTAKWDGATLVTEGTLEASGGSTMLKESFMVGTDGALTLTL